MDSISVIFVLSNEYNSENEAGEVMLQAYEACKQYKVNTTWIKEKDIVNNELKKTDFIVFESFEGKDFENIKKQKSASILGPWCLLICLMEGKKIPNFQWPIYNIAMYNCIISISHLPKSTKSLIGERIQSMGAYYTATLTENTTHLIADSVKSAKYLKAMEMKIKIMTPAWVDAVWKASKDKNVHCDDACFEKFKCLPFHNLIICCTGSTNIEDRKKIEQLIIENGGKFTPKLHLKSTDVLICQGSGGAMTEKFKEARKTGTINCVTVQWLYDSIKKGFCLPCEDYVVKKGTSTPQKSEFIDPNFSTMSAIVDLKNQKSMVDESLLPKHLRDFNSPVVNNKKKVTSEYDDVIEQIDVRKAKKSGQFLDGCSVYLVGFREDQREKLIKVINTSGATRCDDMSDRVTHVIVGDQEAYEVKLILSKDYSCFLVNVKWLLDCIDKKKPCAEDPYLVNSIQVDLNFKSPLGKKGLSLLRSNKTITEVDLSHQADQDEKDALAEELDQEAENEMMKHYLAPQKTAADEDTLVRFLENANYESNQVCRVSQEDRSNTQSTSEAVLTVDSQKDSQPPRVFNGLTFYVYGFDEIHEAELDEHIADGFGKVTKDLEEANYIIVSTFIDKPLDFEDGITVNELWIFDCITEEELVEIKYYHRPLLIRSNTVLENCVVTISGFSRFERQFLSNLIDHLGGISQEQFCRVTMVERNILGSTHLVTAEPNGKKYAAAIKWHLPAVGKDWLLQCAKLEVRPPEESFLVTENQNRDDPGISKSSQASTNQSNKENVSSDKSENSACKDSTRNPLVATPSGQNSSQSNFNDKPPRDVAGYAAEVKSSNSDSDMNATTSSMKAMFEYKTPSSSSHTASADTSLNNSSSVPREIKTSKSSIQSETGLSTSSSNKAVVDMYATPTATSLGYSGKVPMSSNSGPGQRDAKTPKWNLMKTPGFGDDPCSQVTPVHQIMKEVRKTNLLGTPESPQLARAPWEVDTPETPYGAFIDSNPSKSLRKEMLRFLNQFPERPPSRKRKLSTPFSELKRRLWAKIGSGCQEDDDPENVEPVPEIRRRLYERETNDDCDVDEDVDYDEDAESEKISNTQNALIHTRLQQLEEVMTAAGSNSANKSRRQSRIASVVPEHVPNFNLRESQPSTVQWDFGRDTQEEVPNKRVFMFSGLGNEAKTEMGNQLRQLGGVVLDTANYSEESTHLLCPKPARNEKTLSCMAAGKWILHIDYVDACVKAGKFLKEDDYEFGNPSSIGKISIEFDRDVETRMQAIHYWRNEISRTRMGAFHDMRAIVVAEKKQALVNVIEAGGGTVVNAEPPFDGPIHATHCLIEAKSASNFSLYEPLAKQGVYCVNTVYLSDFLHRTSDDIKDSILPFYQKYFR